MASEKQWEVLEKEGWEFASFEYDGTAQLEARQYQNQGYEVKLMKERTDTQGLKLYSIWKKKVGMKQGNIGNLDDWVQEADGTWTYEGYDFTAYIKPNEYWNGRILVEVYYWGFTPKFKGDYDSCMSQTAPDIDNAFDIAEEIINELSAYGIVKGGSKKMKDKMAAPWQQDVPPISDSSEWIDIGEKDDPYYVWNCGQGRHFVISDDTEWGYGWIWVEYPFTPEEAVSGKYTLLLNHYRHETGFSSKEEAWRSLADWWSSDANHRHAELMERSAFAAGFKAGRKHADKKAMKKKASLGSEVFTNEFIVDVDVEVDLEQFIDEYPETFGCESGDEVLEKIEQDEITEDDISDQIADFLRNEAYISDYANDTIGVEVSSPFEIRDIYSNEWLQDWHIGW